MNYCPFGIDFDPGVLGLVTVPVQTRYGSVIVRTSRERRSETGTMYIHGVGADWTTWTPMIRGESKLGLDAHDQIFVDLPGFGDSENKLDQLDIVEVGATFLQVCSALGYSRIRIVGHSMGGFLTLDMASRHPERIASIHLVAGPYFSILNTIQHPVASLARSPTVATTFGMQYLLALTGGFEVSALKRLYQLGMLRPLLAPFARYPFHLKETVVRALGEQVNPRGLIQAAANGDGYDANRQWSQIRCPIWAVFGGRDRLVPQKDMSRLLACQPMARCTVLRDAGHLVHIEWPIEVLRALKLWH